jgi:tetratricopeptide (TPR) repeat protein
MADKMNADDHLRIARRLHFQGDHKEAIQEYERVLELDPDNVDARNGLLSLGEDDPINQMPGLPQDIEEDFSSSTALKRNFFANQASSGSGERSKVKSTIMAVAMIVLFGAFSYGAYTVAMFYLNYDNLNARQNIDVHFERARFKNGQAQVNIEIINKNPYLVRKMLVFYEIKDRADNLMKEGKVTLNGSVPPGDRRTFPDVSLGELSSEPGKLKARVETVEIGPKKYKMKEKWANKFMEAAGMKDKDALYIYEELTDDLEDFAPVYVGYGRALAAKGKFDDALKQYQKALELDQDNANAHYYSAVALYYKKDRANAKKEIDLAVNLAPDDPEILWNQKYLFTMKDPVKKDGKDAAKQGK